STLSAAGQDARSIDVATDRHGDAVAIWQRARSTTAVVQASRRPAGGSWSAAADVSAAGAFAPRVALDGHGDATAIWIVGDDRSLSGTAVGYADQRAGGAWSAPTSIADTSALAPALDVAPDGRAVAIWLAYFAGSQPKVRAISRAPGAAWDVPVT